MKNEEHDYHALALGFIFNTLSSPEKHLVHELVLHDADFLQVLKLDLALTRHLTSLKQPIPDCLKRRVRLNVTASMSKVFYKQVFHTVLKSTLPTLAWPALHLLERSVFANE